VSFTDPHLATFITGIPRPQGSLTMVTSRFAKYSDTTIAHRNHVVAELRREWGDKAPLTGPLALVASFRMPRPKYHYGTGRNADVLKASAPEYPTTPGDLDKLLRCLFDSLEISGVLRNDSIIVHASATKRYAEPPGDPGTFLSLADIVAVTP